MNKPRSARPSFCLFFLCAGILCAGDTSADAQTVVPQLPGAERKQPADPSSCGGDITGAWENQARIVQFSYGENGSGICRFILKTYYGFYFDDAASLPWRYISGRSVSSGNAGTDVSFAAVMEHNVPAAAGIELRYPGDKEYTGIPLYVQDNRLYLDFYLKPADSGAAGLAGFWRAGGNLAELTVSPQYYAGSVYSYYFAEKEMYRIRYWAADVPYTDETAFIREGDMEYLVDKYIAVGPYIYTCTEGRSRLVRSPEKTGYYIEDNSLFFDTKPGVSVPFFLSSDERFLSFSKPYMTRRSSAGIDAYIEEHNSYRRPPRKPPLP